MIPLVNDMELWEEVKRTVTPLSEAIKTALRKKKTRAATVRRLDLHGYTAQEAYQRTLSVLKNSFQRGDKQLLIITGKGYKGQGILRRELPLWLADADLPIKSVQQAPIEQGGEGAYIVKLKRRPK